MTKWNTIRRIRRASEIARNRANKRWELDRARRTAIAAADPIKFTGRIVRRIVVIDGERLVREATIYDFDSARSARRKVARVLIQ